MNSTLYEFYAFADCSLHIRKIKDAAFIPLSSDDAWVPKGLNALHEELETSAILYLSHYHVASLSDTNFIKFLHYKY